MDGAQQVTVLLADGRITDEQDRQDGRMAMTAKVKDELSRFPITKTCCRKAEIAAMLRFAGGLHIVGGRIVVEAELDTLIASVTDGSALNNLSEFTQQAEQLDASMTTVNEYCASQS
mgnify:CR=1 FL=1